MQQRPEDFHFALGIGSVSAVYPSDWEVDLLGEDGQTIQRALVIGPRLPEISTRERPQICEFGYIGHLQGRAVCRPIESRLPGERIKRADVVYYDEVQAFRETITRAGVWELRNSKGPLLQLRILEQDGVIRIDTPKTRAVFKDSDGSIDIHCDGDLTADVGGTASVTVAKDATATVGGNVQATVVGNVTVQTAGSLTATAAMSAAIQAPAISLTGEVSITGTLAVSGSIAGGGTVSDQSGVLD